MAILLHNVLRPCSLCTKEKHIKSPHIYWRGEGSNQLSLVYSKSSHIDPYFIWPAPQLKISVGGVALGRLPNKRERSPVTIIIHPTIFLPLQLIMGTTRVDKGKECVFHWARQPLIVTCGLKSPCLVQSMHSKMFPFRNKRCICQKTWGVLFLKMRNVFKTKTTSGVCVCVCAFVCVHMYIHCNLNS